MAKSGNSRWVNCRIFLSLVTRASVTGDPARPEKRRPTNPWRKERWNGNCGLRVSSTLQMPISCKRNKMVAASLRPSINDKLRVKMVYVFGPNVVPRESNYRRQSKSDIPSYYLAQGKGMRGTEKRAFHRRRRVRICYVSILPFVSPSVHKISGVSRRAQSLPVS